MTDKHLNADGVIKLLKGRSYKWAQVHHTYKPNHDDFTGKNHQALQDGMRNYHMNNRGWQDIGQHLTLFPDGTFLTGRNFSTNPAGIAGYNSGAFMIEIIGNFDKGHDKLEGKQLQAALKVYNYLTTHNGSTIMFHNEKANKSCPGTGVDKGKFVKEVKNYKDDGKADVSVSGNSGDSSASKPKDDGKLSVDGYWGKATTRALQKALGTTQDGVLSGQNKNSITNQLESNTVSTSGSNGSLVVKELQKLVGTERDGLLGPATIKALQKLLGTTQDGKLSKPSLVVKEMQRQLNSGDFGKKKASSGSKKSSKQKENLTVDGKWGKGTTKALQRALGTTADGIISGQNKHKTTNALYGGTVSFKGSHGSQVIKALQKKIGANADGSLGPSTVKALQKYLGTTQDGVLSRPSLVVKEMQRKLNAGAF